MSAKGVTFYFNRILSAIFLPCWQKVYIYIFLKSVTPEFEAAQNIKVQ